MALAIVTSACSGNGHASPVASSVPSSVPPSPTSTTVPGPVSTDGPNLVAVVRWIAAPAQPNQRLPFALTLPARHSTAPPCSANALQVLPDAEGSMGEVYGWLDVHNISNAVCEVQGIPFVELLDTKGRIVHSTDPADRHDDSPPVILEPNSWAYANIGPITSNTCGGGQASTIKVRWHDGVTTMPLPVGRPPDPESCPGIPRRDRRTPGDLQQKNMGGPFAFIALRDASTQFPGYSLSGLTTTIDAPANARAGQVVNFTVQMVNVTDNMMIFTADACPIYRAAIGTETRQMLLNCGGEDGQGIFIPQGSAVRFDMQIEIPSDTLGGPHTLTWAPIEPAGPATSATVDIVT
jgi:hypothetical protein